MGRGRKAIVCCCVAALGAAGCGSSSKNNGPTQAQVIAKGDPICAHEIAVRRGLKPPQANPATANPATIKTFAPYLSATTASLRREVQGIEALGTPRTGAALLKQAIAQGQHDVALQMAATQAAAKGNVPAFRAAFASLSKINGPPPQLKQFGFKVCGESG